jgi:Zn-dependent protease with chaperone function
MIVTRALSHPWFLALIVLGQLVFYIPTQVWSGLDDQHDVKAIVTALQSPIPNDVVAEAQATDDQLMKGGEFDGTKIYLVTDERAGRVDRLVRKLLTAMKQEDREWVVRVLDTEPSVVNAFVTGGKYIYVFTGLLQQAGTEDELAFVLGHEIGHSLLKQNLRRKDDITTTLGGLATLIAAVAAKNSLQDVQAVTQAVGADYSRTDEEEADALAVAIAWRAGFDPLRGVDFFSRGAKESHKAQKAQEEATQYLAQVKVKVEAEQNDCIARINAIRQVQANRQMVNPDYANQTQMLCNQVSQNVAGYNAMTAEYNQKLNEQSLAAIYRSHPSDQNRVASVAALTDYVRGRRPLESLQQFQQGYRVMTALYQTNSLLLQKNEKPEIKAVIKPKTVAQEVTTKGPSQKSLTDQLNQLKRGLEEGLISEEEYKIKRKEIIERF